MGERADLFDIDRQRTGETVERGMPLPVGRLHTVVHLVLINSRDEMLIQRRSDSKKYWPGLWDLTVGGSVIAGETSREGIARETREELGLELDVAELRPALTMNFPFGFDDYYIVRRDLSADEMARLAVPNAEVAEVAWASLDRVVELKHAGHFIEYRDSVLAMLMDFVDHTDVFEVSPTGGY